MDDALRELARRATTPLTRAQYLAASCRAGRLDLPRLQLAAFLGDPGARVLYPEIQPVSLDQHPEDPETKRYTDWLYALGDHVEPHRRLLIRAALLNARLILAVPVRAPHEIPWDGRLHGGPRFNPHGPTHDLIRERLSEIFGIIEAWLDIPDTRGQWPPRPVGLPGAPVSGLGIPWSDWWAQPITMCGWDTPALWLRLRDAVTGGCDYLGGYRRAIEQLQAALLAWALGS